MESQVKSSVFQAVKEQYHSWWNQLSETWKLAFNEALFQKKTGEAPTDDQLEMIWNLKVLRMAGPRAMFPNMSIALDDLSGVKDLENLEILIICNHNISSLQPISGLKNLHSLFVFSNELTSLEGIEGLKGLQKLYINDNHITSLKLLAGLTSLETIHCAHNKIESFDGIGTQHTALTEFLCLPNDGIWASEIMRFENESRIRCLKG